jgi:hypothetical protein
MATDVALLGYSTLSDVVGNYTSLDSAARFVMPTRILDRMTPLVKMLPMKASNNILSNIALRTDSLPTASNRMFNQGIKSTASKNTSLNDPIALFQDRSSVDYDLWRIQNDPNAWRADQDMNHIEGLMQLMESTLFYGSIAQNIGAFNGLSTRFNNFESYPNGDTSGVFQPNVWSGGATTGPCTSAWMIEFGEDTVYGIYPPNTQAGMSIRSIGEQQRQLAAQTGSVGDVYAYQVLETILTWYMGMQVADECCVQRIANINPVGFSGPNGFDENIFIQAKNNLRRPDSPTVAIFVNRQLKSQIDIRAVSQKINAYTDFDRNGTDVWGKPVTTFQGIPIYVAEKLLSTESPLT